MGSRNWTTEEGGGDLGEVVGARQRWSNGTPPDLFPSPVTLGEPDCLEFGESKEVIGPWVTTEEDLRIDARGDSFYIDSDT